MRQKNFLVGIGMILLALALILESNNVINNTVFSIMLGITLGLGILNFIIPCIKKKK